MTKKFSLIVPCYNVQNPSKNISEIINEVISITPDFEIIFVNDGSKYFPTLAPSSYIKIITHEKNKGKGEALMSGLRISRGEIIAFIDADLQIPPTLLKPYYNIMKSQRNPDILIGSKRHHNSKVSYPFSRRVMSWAYQTMNRFMFGLKVQDSQVGLKMFKREVADEILPSLTVKRFAFDLEFLVAASNKDFSILEAPVQIKESFSSTINPKAVIKMIQDTLGIFYRYKFKKAYER